METGTDGNRRLTQIDFAPMTCGLDSIARQSGNPEYTMDLEFGRMLGASRDGISGSHILQTQVWGDCRILPQIVLDFSRGGSDHSGRRSFRRTKNRGRSGAGIAGK